MNMSKETKLTIKWSKKEKDLLVYYPTRNGSILGRQFIYMITDWEEKMKKSQPAFKDLRQYMIDAGFDPDTFTISVKIKTP